MGCLCPKKKGYINNDLLKESLNQGPAPFGTSGDIEANVNHIENTKFVDLIQKKKLVEYLFKNEIKVFKQLYVEIKGFNDEQFNALFEGNMNYQNFKVSDQKRFKSILRKFETHNSLLMEFYENEEYYVYADKIWQKNLLLQSLNNKNEQERINIFKENNIDYENWPKNIKDKIQSIINNSSEFNFAEIMKDFIEENYGNIDDLIEKTENCKTMVEKNIEKSHCKRILNANLETITNKLLYEQIPNFLKNLPNCCKKINDDIKKEQINRSIEKINKAGLSENKKKSLIDQVKNIYKKKNKNTVGNFNANKELKELNELGIKINNEKINEVGFFDKVGMGLANKNIGSEFLAFSLLNLNYSIIHLNNTLEYETNFYKCNLEEFEDIRRSFYKHKEEVKLITDNIDESAIMMKELRKKFEEDRIRINKLINNINDALNEIRTQQNQNIWRLIGECAGSVVGFLATIVTKGDNQGDYLIGAGANLISIISTSKDIHETKELIGKYNKTLQDAEKLQKEINDEIIKLEKRFNSLKTAHLPKAY